MISGVVKKIFADRGFCFIRPDDGSRDVFLHFSILEREGLTLCEGDRVLYESGPSPRDSKREQIVAIRRAPL